MRLGYGYGADIGPFGSKLENATMECADDGCSCTALIAAVYPNASSAVKLLIEKGASIDERNKTDQTALALAAAGGKLEVVNILIDHGAGLEAQDVSGSTPVHAAAARVHENII
jgi:ankyrin repeat protein